MRLSRSQIEILIVGALVLAFLAYNFGGLNITLPSNNENTLSTTNTSMNTPNEHDNVSAATNISTNTYSAHGVSFNYPSTWSMYSDNSTGDELIMVYKNDNTRFQVQITPNNGMSEQEVIDLNENSVNLFGWWNKISNSTLKINNKTAYRNTYLVYSVMPFIVGDRFEEIYFVKNNNTYIMLLQAPDNDFNKEKPNFDVILNSFRVQ